MIDDEHRSLFRGMELPRLLALLALAVVGWVVVWKLAHQSSPPEEPPIQAGAAPAPIEPDRSPAFETVSDKTVLGFRDSAAYALLLDRARDLTPAALAARARSDIALAQIYERPAHFRGVPIQLLGTARLVYRNESKLSRNGGLYEAWVFTTDSQSYPYVCVFEEAPKGFPVGAGLSERVVFNGYFLKLMRYQAGDVPRAAPVLVGRIGWSPPKPGAPESSRSLTFWMAVLVGVAFLYTLSRWLAGLKRSITPRPAASLIRDRPTEEIDPEALAEWVDSVADDADRLRKLGEGKGDADGAIFNEPEV
jgi:hypothetical protein